MSIERRVYVGHKKHGTCVTYEARVYLAPPGVEYAKGSSPRIDFTVSTEGLVDPEGRVWACGGENPGCGPRLPKELREQHARAFAAMSHDQRREFLKGLTPSK